MCIRDRGFSDPITCFEYMGRFYVQEGHKRVSVLKSYGAPYIQGYVTRIIPSYSNDPAVQIYYEFMRFYQLCGQYQITFRQKFFCFFIAPVVQTVLCGLRKGLHCACLQENRSYARHDHAHEQETRSRDGIFVFLPCQHQQGKRLSLIHISFPHGTQWTLRR